MNLFNRVIRLASILIFIWLPHSSALAETGVGMVIEINVENRYVVLEDELAYTLSDNFKTAELSEGDVIEIKWDWTNGIPVISELLKKP